MKTHPKLARRNAAALFGAGFLLALIPCAQAAPTRAQAADNFVDSIGVNLHLGFASTPYDGIASVTTSLKSMGIRHYRDGLEDPDFKKHIKPRYASLAEEGIRGTFISGLTGAKIIESADLMGDAVEAFEGQNEIINTYTDKVNGAYPAALIQSARDSQITLFNAVKGSSKWRNTPVLGPTCVGKDAWQALGDLTAYMDYGAFHPYPGDSSPAEPSSNFFGAVTYAASVAGGLPLYATEAGYRTGTPTTRGSFVSARAASKYAPRLLLENYNRGVVRTFWYEFLDQGDSTGSRSWGLYDQNFNLKPAGAAVNNLIGLLKDATLNATTKRWESPNPDFMPGKLDFSLSGTTANVHSTLLQKTNGKFYLCLWQEVRSYNADNNVEADINNPNVSVTLNLNSPVSEAKLYEPTNGGGGTALTVSNNRINLSVPDQVIIVELTPKVALTGTYKLLARHSSKALDVAGASTANGANVQQWGDGNQSNKQWIIEPVGGGYYTLKAKHSGLMLALDTNKNTNGTSPKSATANGANVFQYGSDTNASRQWKIEIVNGDFFRLINKQSGRALTVKGGEEATGDGVNVFQWDYKGGRHQQWNIEQISDPITPLSGASSATITASASGGGS